MAQPDRLRIGILGTSDSPYVHDLLRAASLLSATEPGLELQVFRFNDMFDKIGLQTPEVPADSSVPEVDAWLVRSMPLGSLEQVIFRMDCLQVWERRGVPVVNPPRSLETAIDKWLTLHRLQLAGVPVPATVACQSRGVAMDAFEQLGRDVLVKPLFGGEGRGIIRLSDPDMAWRVLGTLQQVGQVLYVQQFCPHFGYDIRVLFVGEQIFAMKRIAEPGGWKTNLSQGSQAAPHDLTADELEMARRAAGAVGGSVLGVDLLPCRDGRLLALEVNAVPGWRGINQALQVDIARTVLEHVIAVVRGMPPA